HYPPPHVPLVPPMPLTPIAPTLLTSQPALPTHLIGTTPLGLPHLHSSCLTSDSLTLLMPPNHSTHTVHPAHPTYTTSTAQCYCANCPVLPAHAPPVPSHVRPSESAVIKPLSPQFKSLSILAVKQKGNATLAA